MNVLIILRAIILYIKTLFYLKVFGTECAPYEHVFGHFIES